MISTCRVCRVLSTDNSVEIVGPSDVTSKFLVHSCVTAKLLDGV